MARYIPKGIGSPGMKSCCFYVGSMGKALTSVAFKHSAPQSDMAS